MALTREEIRRRYRESEKGKATEKEYRRRYKEDGRRRQVEKRQREKYLSDPVFREHRKAIDKRCKKKNYHKYKPKILERNRLLRKKQKEIVMNHYSNGTMMCALCDVHDIDMLTIDHIYGGGNKARREAGISAGARFYRNLIKNGFPSGYRVLCWNHQFKESLRLGYRGKYLQAPKSVVEKYDVSKNKKEVERSPSGLLS